MNAVQLIQKYEKPILIGVGGLSFTLGLIGYAHLYFYSSLAEDYPGWEWTDVVYSTLGMFVLEAETHKGSLHHSLALEVARFLALIVLAWALLKAALRVFTSNRMEWRVGNLMDHTIIVGRTPLAVQMFKELCALDEDLDLSTVLYITTETDESLNAEVESVDGCYLVGGLHAADTWSRARLEHARRVFVFTDSDAVNEEVGHSILRSLDTSARVRPLELHLAISERLSSHTDAFLAEHRSEQVNIHLLDAHRLAARDLFLTHPPHANRIPGPGERPIHVAVLGFTELAQQIFCHAVRTCHYTDLQRPMLTIIDDEDQRAWTRMRQRVPAMDLAADVCYHRDDPGSLEQADWDRLQQRGAFDAVYVAVRDHTEGLILAERLARFFPRDPDRVHVYLCLDKHTSAPRNSVAHGYATFVSQDACTYDQVARESLDAIAMKIHARYHAKYPGLPPWSHLDESNRNANRDASDHREVVEAILRTGGSTWADAGPGTELEERLSEAEHRRWMASKVMSGFAYGATRDKVKKLHPDLVDYAGLSEDAKEKDRENVRFLATLSSVS